MKRDKERCLGVVVVVMGFLLLALFVFAQLLPAFAYGQTPACPECITQRPQPWYAQPIRPPVQQVAPVRPASPRPRKGHEAVVRVIVDDGGSNSLGSGTIVDANGKTALVLTVAHLFANQKGGVVVVVAGKRFQARLLRRDVVQDLAALKIVDPKIGRAYIRKTALPIGSKAWGYGYGRGTYGGVGGRLAQMISPGRRIDGSQMRIVPPSPGETGTWGEFSMGVREGDSGGPILDETGYLVGMISGTDGIITCGPCFPRIRAFLRCVLPPYPNRPGILIPKPVAVMPVRPTLPPPWQPSPTPTPTLPAPTPSPVVAPTINYEKLAALVYAKIEANADKFRGPQGLPQPTPAINYDTLAAEVIARLPPVKLHLQYPNAEVIELAAPLGEGIVLPPVRAEWERLDGTILYQEKPLGEALRFKSVEIDVGE